MLSTSPAHPRPTRWKTQKKKLKTHPTSQSVWSSFRPLTHLRKKQTTASVAKGPILCSREDLHWRTKSLRHSLKKNTNFFFFAQNICSSLSLFAFFFLFLFFSFFSPIYTHTKTRSSILNLRYCLGRFGGEIIDYWFIRTQLGVNVKINIMGIYKYTGWQVVNWKLLKIL